MRAGTTWNKAWRTYSSDKTRVREKTNATVGEFCVRCDGPVAPIITKNGGKIRMNTCAKCRKGA